jgi:hypothetical protein
MRKKVIIHQEKSNFMLHAKFSKRSNRRIDQPLLHERTINNILWIKNFAKFLPDFKATILRPVISDPLKFDDPITRSPKPDDQAKRSILSYQQQNRSSKNNVSPKEIKKDKIDECVSFVYQIPRKIYLAINL